MAFNQEWNETTPSGAENPNLGDNRIREFKEAIRERLAEDHAFYSDEAGKVNVGHHKQVMLVEQAGDSVTVEDELALYCKNLDGQPELYCRPQSAGTPIQITKEGGKLNEQGGVDIPSDEIILFEKDTAVVGYTLQTDKDDTGVYITKGSGAGGEEGATDKDNGTWTISGLQVNDHHHSMQSHTHSMQNHTHTLGGGSNSCGSLGDNIVASGDFLYTCANSGATYPRVKSTTGGPSSGATGGPSTTNTGDAAPAVSSSGVWRSPGRNFTRQQRN